MYFFKLSLKLFNLIYYYYYIKQISLIFLKLIKIVILEFLHNTYHEWKIIEPVMNMGLLD